MADEPEVLREQIRETQESLASKLSTLEDKVVNTVSSTTESVSETVENVKETVAETVENVKEKVTETIETVKRTFDLEYQVQEHPWLMMAGSCALGFAAGRLLPRAVHTAEHFMSHLGEGATHRSRFAGAAPAPSPPPNGSAQGEHGGWFANLAREFGAELEQVKGLALGALLGLARDWATQNLPGNLAPHIEEMVDNLTAKVGGTRIEGPVLANLQSMYAGRKEA
jgi:ElaB/YqjD/DUF883 family membrane-anchored ribosome-binding protein